MLGGRVGTKTSGGAPKGESSRSTRRHRHRHERAALVGIIPLLVGSGFLPAANAGGDASATIDEWNATVLALNEASRVSVGNDRSAALSELADALGERRALMEELARRLPGGFLDGSLATRRDEFPAPLRPQIERSFEARGALEVLHIDDEQRHKGRVEFSLDVGHGRLDLVFQNDPPAAWGRQAVTIDGVRLGDLLVVPAGEEHLRLEGAALVPTDLPSRARTVLVLMFNFEDDAREPWPLQTLRDTLFTDSGSVNAFYREVSSGRISLTGRERSDGDIRGYYTVPFDNRDCARNWRAWTTAVRAFAAAEGVDVPAYDHVFYVFPAKDCTTPGWSYLNVKESWVTTISLRTLAHELGHNLGLHHAGAYECQAAGTRVSLSDDCTLREYGDPFDVMGTNGVHHPSVVQKARLGWLPEVITVGAAGLYALGAAETQGSHPSVLRIPREREPGRATDSYLYLEFRQDMGFDNFGPDDKVTQGVLVRVGPDLGLRTKPALLDMTPSTPGFEDAALGVGDRFTDPLTGFTIRPLEIIGSTLQLLVEAPGSMALPSTVN